MGNRNEVVFNICPPCLCPPCPCPWVRGAAGGEEKDWSGHGWRVTTDRKLKEVFRGPRGPNEIIWHLCFCSLLLLDQSLTPEVGVGVVAVWREGGTPVGVTVSCALSSHLATPSTFLSNLPSFLQQSSHTVQWDLYCEQDLLLLGDMGLIQWPSVEKADACIWCSCLETVLTSMSCVTSRFRRVRVNPQQPEPPKSAPVRRKKFGAAGALLRRSFRGSEVKTREESTDFAYLSFKSGKSGEEEDGRQRGRREQLYFDFVNLGVER